MTDEQKQNIFKILRISIMVIAVIIMCSRVWQFVQVSKSQNALYTTGEGFGVSGLVDHAEDVADAQVDESIVKFAKDINWEYGDPSLYYEDFSDIEKALDEKSNRMTEAYFKPKVDFPFYLKTENQYYLPVLKEIRDGKLSVEEALDDPSRTIRIPSFDMYYWMTSPDEESFVYSDIASEYYTIQEESGIRGYIYRFYGVIDENINFKEIEESQNAESPIQYLIDSNAKLFTSVMSDKMSGYIRYYDDNGLGNFLKNKYNQEFKPALFEYSFNEGRAKYYYPVSDPSLKFAATDYGDLYLAVLAQRAMYEEIDKIIEEEGYGGQIAHMSIPNKDNLEMGDEKKHYDMSRKYDNRKIVNEVYDGCYDTSLLLLLEEDEEIDYAKLQKISARIQDLFYTNVAKDEENWQRSDLFIYFYTLPKIEQKIVVDLFERDRITETFFRGMTESIADIYVNMYIVRVETEGFHYLDVRAKKTEFFLNPLGDFETLMSLSKREFEDRVKTTRLIY
ncbi:hypothetical protein [Fusibacter ferrireducens]|uniref:DUF4825 domain-containing protein n=1 Tax=Fusibacter ferrireducens TaxID=2785058 RepID=A0ABR9ZQC5_9FIRM|nr:hypothetical protein [Fusibacter ferrireducens]MBF4692652.1 hypothetical protein [Fusibacter ferrireducens]